MYLVNSVIVPKFLDKMNITLTTSDLETAIVFVLYTLDSVYIFHCWASVACIRRWSWAEHHQSYSGCPSPVLLRTCHQWICICTYSKESFVRMDIKHQNLVILWWYTYTITSWGFCCPAIILCVITIILGPALLCERNTFLICISFPSLCHLPSECRVHVNSL